MLVLVFFVVFVVVVVVVVVVAVIIVVVRIQVVAIVVSVVDGCSSLWGSLSECFFLYPFDDAGVFSCLDLGCVAIVYQ